MIDVALVSLLNGVGGVTAYAGGEVAKVSRTLPRVAYTLIGIVRRYCDDGNAGLTQARYQLDIFAALPSTARGLADAIRVALDGYAGTADGTRIERIYFESERHESPERMDGEAVSVSRFSQDVIIEYREPV